MRAPLGDGLMMVAEGGGVMARFFRIAMMFIGLILATSASPVLGQDGTGAYPEGFRTEAPVFAKSAPSASSQQPPSGIAWTLFWGFVALLFSVFGQVREVSRKILQDGQTWLRGTKEWRFISVFTALLLVATILQLGYASFLSDALGGVVNLDNAAKWLVFAFGFCPLPVLALEVYCVNNNPEFGVTRHYHNNLRLAGGWWARSAAYLARILRRRKGYLRLAWFWKTIDWLLTYAVATVFFVHISCNFKEREWKTRRWYTATQLLVDLVVFSSLSLGLITLALLAAKGLGVGVKGDADLIRVAYWIPVMLGYIAGYSVLLQSDIPAAPATAQSRSSSVLQKLSPVLWLLPVILAALAAGFDIITNGGIVAEAALPRMWWRAAPHDLLMWALRMVQLSFGGYGPAALVLIVYTLMFRYQKAVSVMWQNIGLSAGDKTPFFLMKMARHRLRNYVTPIYSALDGARMGMAQMPDGPRRNYLVGALERARHAMVLIEEWFEDRQTTGNQIAGAQDRPSERLISVRDMVEGAATGVKDFLATAKTQPPIPIEVQVILDQAVADWRVRLNEGDWSDAMNNLTRNAAEALTDARSGQVPACPTIWIEARHRHSRIFPLYIVVRDNGPGIPRRQRDLVFEPFQTSKGYGSGLGLFVARAFFQRMGGELSLERSAPAVFVANIPRDRLHSDATEDGTE